MKAVLWPPSPVTDFPPACFYMAEAKERVKHFSQYHRALQRYHRAPQLKASSVLSTESPSVICVDTHISQSFNIASM
ncbi:hypothetical protein BaRGS_00006539 [Batillaria attramentaria]|uniref:Uncharacterized protein n=1 Tax=Batillaria attramentaria TaxID=370345 RepID=A0ABD0LRH7_9CAEN